MSREITVEERLAALEKAVAELQLQMAAGAPGIDWVSKIAGCMKDAPGFEEMVEYGRAFRWADRPTTDSMV